MASIVTGKKIHVGRIVKRMIETRGLAYGDVAKLIGKSKSQISELVAGKSNVSAGDIKLLSERLGFTDEEHINFLLETHKDWKKRGAWSSHVSADYFPETVQHLADLEWDALSVRCVGTEIMPLLLQSEGYIRAMYADWDDRGTDLRGEDAVQGRLRRQEVLRRHESPLELHAVLFESCLRNRFVGMPAQVMFDQLEHLIALSKRANVIVQVLPSTATPAQAIHRFEILELPAPGVIGPIDLAYVEYPGETRFIDDKDVLQEFKATWSLVAAAASSPADARKLMRHIADKVHQ